MLLEEERAELMGCFVQSVEMTETEAVTIELLPVIMSPPLFYSRGFELNPNLGAERCYNPNRQRSSQCCAAPYPCRIYRDYVSPDPRHLFRQPRAEEPREFVQRLFALQIDSGSGRFLGSIDRPGLAIGMVYPMEIA